MRLTPIILLVTLTCFSCKKESGSSLNGKWKMVRYYDRNTSSVHTKPANSEDVFLELDGNKFTAYSIGKSCDGTYSFSNDEITFNTINAYFTTANDSWSDMFFWAIQACQLQSVYPCKPSKWGYSMLNEIRINTVLRMDVMLVKVK